MGRLLESLLSDNGTPATPATSATRSSAASEGTVATPATHATAASQANRSSKVATVAGVHNSTVVNDKSQPVPMSHSGSLAAPGLEQRLIAMAKRWHYTEQETNEALSRAQSNPEGWLMAVDLDEQQQAHELQPVRTHNET